MAAHPSRLYTTGGSLPSAGADPEQIWLMVTLWQFFHNVSARRAFSNGMLRILCKLLSLKKEWATFSAVVT